MADAETGAETWVDTDSWEWERHVRSDAERFEGQLLEVLRRCGTDRVTVVAGEPFVLALGRFFRRRARKFVWA
jgi:hypothetical protein